MKKRIMSSLLSGGVALIFPFVISSCGNSRAIDNRHEIIVSVKDQQMLLVRDKEPLKTYLVSTSKFGLGSEPGSYRTPLGKMRVAKKIGSRAPAGAVFKSRRRTGEVLRPNAPGRDPIVSRILWLEGQDSHNRNTMRRLIYIHGTPQVSELGKPVSYGCIRMDMREVIDLYKRVGYGAKVYVIRGSLLDTEPGRAYAARQKGRRELTTWLR